MWWLLASLLLFYTWNKVVVALFGTKQVKIGQVLLLLATLCILVLPCKVMMLKYHHGYKAAGLSAHSKCPHCGIMLGKKMPCPLSKKPQGETSEQK